MSYRNKMLLLLALCLLCIGGGIQSSVALLTWLKGGTYWIEMLKASSLLLGAVVMFSSLAQAIRE